MPIYEVEINGKAFEVDAPTPEALQKALGQTFEQRVEARKQSNPSEYLPQSPEYQAKYGPLSGSNFQNHRAGAGRAFTELGRGVSQLFGSGPTPEQVDEQRRLDAPLMNTKAGFSGNLLGNVAAAAPTMFIPGANTYTGAALIGGGLGAAQPVGTQDSRLNNAGTGALYGMAGKYGGDKIGNWAARPRVTSEADEALSAMGAARASTGGANAQAGLQGSINANIRSGGVNFGSVGDDASAGLNSTRRDIMERGRAIGMRTTPGQASGSKALQQLEAKLESQPMTSGPFNAIKENNARVLARETAAGIGENADVVDSNTLDRAFTRIGGVFDEAADDVAREIDPQQFVQTFSGIQDDLRGVVKGFGDHPLVNDLVGFAQNGSATGKQLQTLTSKLGKAAQKEMTTQAGDRDLGMGLYQIKDYVDDLLQQGMSGQRAARFQQARTQYRNLMNITSRVGVVNPATGDVSGRSLANVLMKKDKRGYLRGHNRSGMYEAARYSQAFAPIVGDSGTATRAPLQGITEMALRIPYNIAAKAYTSPASVELMMRAMAAKNAASGGARRLLGTAPFYAPYALPGAAASAGNVIFPELDR